MKTLNIVFQNPIFPSFFFSFLLTESSIYLLPAPASDARESSGAVISGHGWKRGPDPTKARDQRATLETVFLPPPSGSGKDA